MTLRVSFVGDNAGLIFCEFDHMQLLSLKSFFVLMLSWFLANAVMAEPVTYVIDRAHTYPAFEADHNGGLSIWRGKITSTTGTVILDRQAQSGSVNVEMDMNSIDFGFEPMSNSAKDHVLNVAEFPTATYAGTLANFVDGSPTTITGTLSLNGVTKPLDLKINQFLCKPHFRHGREVCGADASASFDRSDFNIVYGLDGGFLPFVNLLISVEAGVPEA